MTHGFTAECRVCGKTKVVHCGCSNPYGDHHNYTICEKCVKEKYKNKDKNKKNSK